MEDLLVPRRRILPRWLAILLLIAMIAGVAFAVRRALGSAPAKPAAKKAQASAPAAPVELSPVRRGPIATFVQATTSLEARNSAVLIARRQGQVVSLLTEEGRWVKRGQPLARLDDREARLALDRTQLVAEVAQRDLDRGRQLHDQGYLSKKDLDELEVKLRNATVDLGQARYDLSQTVIAAPFSGRIVDRTINLGETVSEGKECFRIADFDPVLARLYFPERDLPRVRVGQMAAVTLDSRPGKTYDAKVALVSPVVDRANGTFKVTLEVANRSGDLRPGTFSRVRLKTGEFDDALLLPRRGVLTEDGEDYVFVARGDSVVRRTVKLGAVEGEDAQVLSGLAAGERVVTLGQGGLKPGAKIKAVRL